MSMSLIAGVAGVKALLVFLAAGLLANARCFWTDEY